MRSLVRLTWHLCDVIRASRRYDVTLLEMSKDANKSIRAIGAAYSLKITSEDKEEALETFYISDGPSASWKINEICLIAERRASFGCG